MAKKTRVRKLARDTMVMMSPGESAAGGSMEYKKKCHKACGSTFKKAGKWDKIVT
ncbi:MAG: hypothetical protein HQM16_18085 [Deltaproteobacteria bacterium]|nr:hypothetical protein [Deltaproteobacteria bacterium]